MGKNVIYKFTKIKHISRKKWCETLQKWIYHTTHHTLTSLKLGYAMSYGARQHGCQYMVWDTY